MMQRLAWAMIAAATIAGAACTTNDGGTTSGGFPDASSQPDGANTADGSSTDSAVTDSATDSPSDGGSDTSVAPGTFALTSTAFAAGGTIPETNANSFCGGSDLSPPLAWANAPAGTQSYAVVMRDVTLGGSGNYHWVIYDIPATSTSLAQDVQKVASPATPAGAKQTHWSFGADYSYRGPCPQGAVLTHDYQFTVYSFATATIPVPAATTDPAAADLVIQANKTGSASLTVNYTN